MPSRKQRRRREKTFRHDYAWVTEDEEGNEVEVAPAELREKKKDKPAKPKAASGTKPRRTTREPTPPSWRRSIKRGGLWGGVMMITVVFFFQGTPLPARIAWGLMYALAFIPLTYWIDRMAYRSYLRRLAKDR